MGTQTVATLVVVAVLVAVLAVFLVAIGLALTRLSFTLGTIVIGLRAIAQQTRPVGAVVGDIIRDVDGIEDTLEGLVGAVVTAKKAPPVPAPVVGAPTPTRPRRRSQARWSGHRSTPGTPGSGSMSDAVAHGREKVRTPSRP